MGEGVFLRKIKAKDIRDVFLLSNQHHVRENSLNKDPIDWSEHVTWFSRMINQEHNVFFAVVDEKDQFLGQIRFEVDGDQAVVSISLDASLRGKGYASALLAESIRELFCEQPHVSKIIAYVLRGNLASIRLFEGRGFSLLSRNEGTLKYCHVRENACSEYE